MSQNVVVGDTLVWGGVVFRQARQSLFGEGHLPQRQVSGYPGASALPVGIHGENGVANGENGWDDDMVKVGNPA